MAGAVTYRSRRVIFSGVAPLGGRRCRQCTARGQCPARDSRRELAAGGVPVAAVRAAGLRLAAAGGVVPGGEVAAVLPSGARQLPALAGSALLPAPSRLRGG